MTSKAQQPTNNATHLVWAAALVIVGIAVFFRIPQVMPKLADMGFSAGAIGFARVCFYLMGILLVGGGLKKFYHFVIARANVSKKDDAGMDEH